MFVRTLPKRCNQVFFSSLASGDGFRFYGQLYLKTCDSIAFNLTTRCEVAFDGTEGKRSRFQQHATVIPMGHVVGLEIA
jgi:hypothetical protein